MTQIPYLDVMWSITTGCGDDKISPGCTNCYARRMFARKLWKCLGCGGLRGTWTLDGGDIDCPDCHGTGAQDFAPRFHADRLDQPLHWRKPRVVGVSFMGDIAHPTTTYGQWQQILQVIEDCPQHTFLVLTKRPDIMRERLNWNLEDNYMHNLWLGVTVCNQAEADEKIPILLATPAAKRWVSIEPMLGPVDLRPWVGTSAREGRLKWDGNTLLGRWRPVAEGHDEPTLDWVVLGPETGPGKRYFDPQWAIDVREQCLAAGVPYYDKRESHKDWREMPEEKP